MAEVYRVERTDPSGRVEQLALKRMLAGREETLFVKALLREAKVAGDLNHPNIVKVIESGELQGSPFVLMEYIDGVDLASILAHSARRRKRLPLAVVLEILQGAAQGLAYAHTHGVIHRDVSPPNILISKEGTVKITDFGIAKAATSQTRTPFGTLKGKLLYMSPEQLQGADLTPATDIFALGVVTYEMLSGQRPFDGRNEVEIIDRIRRFDVAFDGSGWAQVPGDVMAFCRRAMAPEPGERFSNGAALGEALAALKTQLGIKDGADLLKSLVLEVAASRAATAARGAPPTLRTKKLEVHTVTRGTERTAILMQVPTRPVRPALLAGVVALVVLAVGVAIGVQKGVGSLFLKKTPNPFFQPLPPPASFKEERESTPSVGSLTILAQPWGKVTIQGITDGQISPVKVEDLAGGSYAVTIAYDPKEGGSGRREVSGTAAVEVARTTLCRVNFMDPAPTLRCRVR